MGLVTGGALNGSQREKPEEPSNLPAGTPVDLDLDLHFTTWIFAPGHRIRLAVTNAQFPMLWPTPHPMTMRLELGPDATRLRLPLVPAEPRPKPSFAAPEPRETRPDARTLECGTWPEGAREVRKDLVHGTTVYEWRGSCAYEVGGTRIETTQRNTRETRDDQPADSSFDGEEAHRFRFETGRLVREKTRDEKVPRRFQ